MAGGCAGRNSPAQLRAWGALQTPTPTHIHNTHNVQHTTHNTCSHFEWLNIDASWVKTYAVATLVLAKEAMQVCWPPACRQHTKLCCALCVLQYLINSLVQVLAEQSRAAGAASHLHTMKHVHTHTDRRRVAGQDQAAGAVLHRPPPAARGRAGHAAGQHGHSRRPAPGEIWIRFCV